MAMVSARPMRWLLPLAAACSLVFLRLRPSSSDLPRSPTFISLRPAAGIQAADRTVGHYVATGSLPSQLHQSSTFSTATIGAALAIIAAGLRSKPRSASKKATVLKASPQQIPVVDLEGNQIGEETLNLATLSNETANYVVHQMHSIWLYRQRPFDEWHPVRSDAKKGRKPRPQKGLGRARQGSRGSPLFGYVATHKAKHGLDNKRKKKLPRRIHALAISTVLQSKWKNMKIVQGLEEWAEPRYQDMFDMVSKVTGKVPGERATLLVARNCHGAKEEKMNCATLDSYNNPLYMSGRLIPRLQMRRPRDIDVTNDALHQCLKARRLIISRESFFDLTAKFHAEREEKYDVGWAFKSADTIYKAQIKKLAEEFPLDRAAEFQAAAEVPKFWLKREFWARELRQKLAAKVAR